jgi:ATP-dependent 26S proteasome regulatory subunit
LDKFNRDYTLKQRSHEEIKWLFLAEMTEYFTYAEIENIVNESGRQAISMKSFITTNILGTIISNTRPSLDGEKMKLYY